MTGPALTLVMHSNKAVAVGAISYYVDHFVTGRISKFTYGIPCGIIYDSSNPEHVRRKNKSYVNVTGDKAFSGGFDTMLSRVCQPSPLVNTPRQFRRIAGYQGSGGPRSPTPLPLGIRRRPSATDLPASHQVHWREQCPPMDGYRAR